MAPYFGSSIYVWGSIITIFMLSLSLGYLFGGKLSLHFPSLKKKRLYSLTRKLSKIADPSLSKRQRKRKIRSFGRGVFKLLSRSSVWIGRNNG